MRGGIIQLMSIEIRTVEDLVRVLKEHPEWREAVLEALLGPEFLQVPTGTHLSGGGGLVDDCPR